MSGDLTDEEAREYRESILNDPAIGGGYYVQGDLMDSEGNELVYGQHSTVYPMVAQDDGTFVATGVVVQNRANLANANARAGVYISRLEEVYKANQCFTPLHYTCSRHFQECSLTIKATSNDFQMSAAPTT